MNTPHALPTRLVHVLLVVWAGVLCSCNGQGVTPPVSASPGQADGSVPPDGSAVTYDKARGTATLRGVVRYVGTIPPQRRYSMDSEPRCCPDGTPAPVVEKTEVNAGGTLPHAFVRLVEGPETTMAGFEPRPVEVDQKGCTYVPHVFGAMAGQDVTFRNSDTVHHGVHVKDTRQKEAFNICQTAGQVDVRRFDKELGVRIICDIHSWMGATMHVLDHPFYATSARGDGAYEIRGLYPGKHTFRVWHENWAARGRELVFEIDLKPGDNVHDVAVTGDR